MRTRVFGLAAVLGCLLVLVVVAFGVESQVTGQWPCRWEYQILDARNVLFQPEITPEGIDQMGKVGVIAAENLEQVFDRFGVEGWELVSFADEMAVFKRPR